MIRPNKIIRSIDQINLAFRYDMKYNESTDVTTYFKNLHDVTGYDQTYVLKHEKPFIQDMFQFEIQKDLYDLSLWRGIGSDNRKVFYIQIDHPDSIVLNWIHQKLWSFALSLEEQRGIINRYVISKIEFTLDMLYDNTEDRVKDFNYFQQHIYMPKCGNSLTFDNPDFTTRYWGIPEKSNLAFRFYYKDQDDDLQRVVNSNRFEVILDRSCIRSAGINQVPDLMHCIVDQFFKRVELRELSFKKKTDEKTKREIRKILRRYQLNEAAKELGKTPILLKEETDEFRRMLVNNTKFTSFLKW